MWTIINRKCIMCKKLMQIDLEDIIYENDKYYHFDCYVVKQLNKKRNKLSKEECIAVCRNIQKSNEYIIKNIIDREKLYKWIQEKYNVVVLPTTFFIKMESILNGTFKGVSREVPAEELLDMWIRKKDELDRIANNNSKKGKSMTGTARITYDLSILISKYDSYIEWKEKQKLAQEIVKNNIKQNTTEKIDYKKFDETQIKYKNEIDISQILDEI